MTIEVGSIVEIVNDNEYWDGTLAEVIRVEDRADEFRYVLRLTTDTPTGHRKAGENVGGWQRFKVRLVNSQRSKLDAVIEETFNRPVDVFYSPTTGCAVVMAPNGKLIRILADGTVDRA